MRRATFFAVLLSTALLGARQHATPDWPRLEAETMEHFQALLRMDTSDPPGGEAPAVDYLRKVLEKEGIPVKTFALEPNRPNLVARIKGNGKRRPILIMGPHGYGQRRPEEVDVSAVQRHPG